METASLRIKFTPLLSKTKRVGSNCCLEIIPEVSCVQNLDKIVWKQEKEFIEYTIPMTYKIILKKRDSNKTKINFLATEAVQLDKTYYSCVDLLPPSSMSNFDFASGDVGRIISDTYIIGKISAKVYDEKPVTTRYDTTTNATHFNRFQLNCPNEQPDLKQDVRKETVFVDKKGDIINNNAIPRYLDLSDSYIKLVVDKYSLDDITNTKPTNKIDETLSHTKIESNDFLREHPVKKLKVHDQTVYFGDDKRNDIVNDYAIPRLLNLSDSCMKNIIDKYPLDKKTNTENTLTVCKITETLSVETIADIRSRCRDNSKRNLSLSPICSIDTNYKIIPDTPEKIPINIVVDSIFQYKTGDSYENSKLPTRIEKQINIKVLEENSKASTKNHNNNYKRELPQERVAKFIKKMETEIKPLKMLLNDILQQCSTLGLYKNKCIARNLILYKTGPCIKHQMYQSSTMETLSERQTKSNRVVYSIVFDGVMDNESVVEQIVRSLSFEVEAIPQDNIIQVTTTSKSAPLNLKIRVRKKEEAGFRHGVLSLPKPGQPDIIPERIRLVSSDQTIMSFNVVMEADFQKPIKKPRKNILGIFKPTNCLGAQPDEDDYAYLPSTTYKADFDEERTSKSEAALTKFTLKKNDDNVETSKTLPTKKNKDIFGRCKPGGCLDPPFGEDKYTYSPANEQTLTSGQVTTMDELTPGQATENKTKTSSILSNKLFNWKRKSSNDETLDKNVIKKETKPGSVLDLYQAGSLQPSSTYSHSIMTYPSTLNSSETQLKGEKHQGGKIYNDPSKASFNVHSGSYFMIPKKPKNVLDTNNTVKIKDEDIGNAEVVKVKDFIAIEQEQKDENYEKKHALQTKNSVTDVRGAKGLLIEYTGANVFTPNSKEMLPESENKIDFIKNTEENVTPYNINIPFLLTKTEQIESKNTLSVLDKEPKINQNIATDVLTTSPTKRSVSDIIPADIEIISKPQEQNTDENIKEKHKNYDMNLINKEQLPKDIKEYTLGPERGNEIVSNHTLIDTLANNNNHIPLLTKTESTQSNNILYKNDEDSTQNQNNEINNLPALPLTKELISDVPTGIELTAVNMAHINLPTNTLENTKENDQESTKSSTKENNENQGNEFLNEKRWLENQISEESKYIAPKTQNCTSSDIVLKKIISAVDNSKLEAIKIDHLESGIETKSKDLIIKEITGQEGIVTDSQDPTFINEISEINKENTYIPLIQNLDEKESVSKSVMTLDANREMSVYNLTAANSDNVILKDKNNIKKVGDDSQILTHINRDTSLEIVQIERDDLQHIWTNEAHPLGSDTKVDTDDRLNKQSDSNSIHTISLANVAKNENNMADNKRVSILEKSSPNNIHDQNILALDKVKKPSFTDSEKNIQNDQAKNNISKSFDTLFKAIDPTDILSPAENFEQNALLKDHATPLGKKVESSSIVSQRIEELSLVKEKSVTTESIKIKDTLEIFQKRSLEEAAELNLEKTSSPNLINDFDERIISEINDVKIIRKPSILKNNEILDSLKIKNDENNFEINHIKDNTEKGRENNLEIYMEHKEYDPINNDTENNTLGIIQEPPYKSLYPMHTEIDLLSIDFDTEQNNEDDFIKKLPFDNEPKADITYNTTFISPIMPEKTDSSLNLKPKSDLNESTTILPELDPDMSQKAHHKIMYADSNFNSNTNSDFTKIYPESNPETETEADDKIYYPKPNSTVYFKPDHINETTLDSHFPHDKFSQAQRPEAIPKNKTGLFNINFGIQSYVDEDDLVHIKSFDSDITPKRYPTDTFSITKRNLGAYEKIKIPIDLENDLYIQIKNKKQEDIRIVGHNGPENSKQSTLDNKYKSDPTRRNVMIADDIRRTLIAVYEEELLPLRNTITELKDNIEMLTTQQMLIRGHMFVKKPRVTKIVQNRKCGCMRR